MIDAKNRLYNISRNEMKEFIRDNFMIKVDHIEPLFGNGSDKFFVCVSDQNFMEYTGEDSNWCVFGSVGAVRQNVVESSFEPNYKFIELKPNLFKKYILFVAKKNMISGEPVRIGGLTYGEEIAEFVEKYIQSKKQNKGRGLFNKSKGFDAIDKMLLGLTEELSILEKRQEEEPNNN